MDKTTPPVIEKNKNNELRQRVIYSFLLMGSSLAAAIMGGFLWALASSIVSAIIAFEWSMLTGASKRARNITTAIAMVCGFAFVIGQTGIEVLSCVVYIAALMFVGWRGKLLGAIAGAYFAICAFALASLRMDDANGLLYIFGLFSVVWATDSSAYAFGRLLKGPKLFPVVSPNKTWSGFIGGIVTGIAAAALYSVLANIFLNPGNLFKTIGNWSVVGLILSLATQIGDLIESMIKRYFGVKDTSKLIPGHGGLLDRMDGHLSAGLVFSIILSIPFVAALLK